MIKWDKDFNDMVWLDHYKMHVPCHRIMHGFSAEGRALILVEMKYPMKSESGYGGEISKFEAHSTSSTFRYSNGNAIIYDKYRFVDDKLHEEYKHQIENGI